MGKRGTKYKAATGGRAGNEERVRGQKFASLKPQASSLLLPLRPILKCTHGGLMAYANAQCLLPNASCLMPNAFFSR